MDTAQQNCCTHTNPLPRSRNFSISAQRELLPRDEYAYARRENSSSFLFKLFISLFLYSSRSLVPIAARTQLRGEKEKKRGDGHGARVSASRRVLRPTVGLNCLSAEEWVSGSEREKEEGRRRRGVAADAAASTATTPSARDYAPESERRQSALDHLAASHEVEYVYIGAIRFPGSSSSLPLLGAM